MYTNRFSDIAESVVDRFLSQQEELKNYVIEGISKGLSLDEIYESLDESGSPISRRGLLSLGAGFLGTLVGLGAAAENSPAEFVKPSRRSKMRQFNRRQRHLARRHGRENRASSREQMAKHNAENPSVYSSRSNQQRGSDGVQVGMMPGVPPTDVGSAEKPVRKSGRTSFTDV